MANDRLRLYRIDPRYVEALVRADRNVMSTSPQEGKANRPFVGIVIPYGSAWYCIPLSSPKPKHASMKADRDFSKILDKDGKLIGVLNFNNMVPVNTSVLTGVDLHVRPSDSSADRAYKMLMRDQLEWCNSNRSVIRNKAAKLYQIVTEHPERARALVRRCCDFRRLEGILATWSTQQPRKNSPGETPGERFRFV